MHDILSTCGCVHRGRPGCSCSVPSWLTGEAECQAACRRSHPSEQDQGVCQGGIWGGGAEASRQEAATEPLSLQAWRMGLLKDGVSEADQEL